MSQAGPAFAALLAIGVAGCGGCQEDRADRSPPPSTPLAAAATPEATGTALGVTAEVDCFVIVDAEPDFGAPPLTVNFSTEIDCTGQPVSFRWDFGDGSSAENDPKPTHTYAKAGDYIAVVTVSAPDGGRGSDEIDITVDVDLAD
jgi:hypothetical protein